ncbi:chromate transporter [Dyadobacter sp. CY323]|uniref:chromate transporter n=1 Tax=Dyadobacter sp. CY323 TaxID=2907302 RepID=UPI001F3C0D54|nr:chromate transporter [Dyadobacter sp. CY323]MCE6991453.1 chromate transporter [Dyadobacter sp. CY323]
MNNENSRINDRLPSYTLSDLTRYFLKLGTMGFGGPVALIGYMHRELVEDKKWISEDEYREGLALAQLAPGPLAAQLGIYLGYVHYGIGGATLTGLAFVLPSFVMVVLLGMAYKLYGGLPWMQSVFYGVGSAVIGIITLSCYKLTTKSISKIEPEAIKGKWLLWLFFLAMAIVTAITQREEVWLFILLGFIYMVVKAPLKWLQRRDTSLSVILLAGTGFWQYEPGKLVQLGLFFSEAGAFVFGSGLAIIPFLQAGVVNEMGWLNEQQFLDSVAVAMITPGPVVITVGFIGFLVSGFAGAAVAALGVFLPCFVFTVLPAPYFKKISKNTSIKAFVDGITAAVVGALVGSVFVIATRSIVDTASALIAITTILSMVYIKKLQEPYIILAAAIVGFCIKTLL